RRETSIVPQQALALLNGRLVGDCAPEIARRLEATGGDPGDESFVRHAFEQLLGFEPRPEERQTAIAALRVWKAEDSGVAAGANARSRLVWSLVNHGDFVTLR
ncbi:MAG: hypothetical protein RLZZ34_644, partial [Verrucomicrobiota bacterium]